jgi:hypothetical protein
LKNKTDYASSIDLFDGRSFSNASIIQPEIIHIPKQIDPPLSVVTLSKFP